MNGKKLKVVFLDASTIERGDVDFTRFTTAHDCTFHPVTRPADTAARIEGFDVAVTNKVIIDATLMDSPAAALLKLIAIAATGTNNVDLAAAGRRGIAVCNVAGYSTTAVAQHTMNFILELASSAARYAADTRTGAWENSPTFTMLTRPCVELTGKTLGVFGHGTIGSAVARLAQAFGMDILIAARKGDASCPAGRAPFDDVVAQSDFLTVHCPLTPGTQGLLGEREFAMMKNSAFVINTARGGVVDEAALVAALDSGQIAGAATDVLSKEPPEASHPLIAAAKRLDNLLVTPHTAWTAREARQRLVDEMALNIEAYVAGQTRNRVEKK